jgi:hypothetical protein
VIFCFLQSLPRYFVQAHKTYLLNQECVVGLNNKSWSLRLNRTSQEEFIFTRGWRRFVTDNGCLKGDILVFSLTAMSEFQLYLFNNNGLWKAPQMLQASAHPKRKASSDDIIADPASNIAACQNSSRQNTRSTKAVSRWIAMHCKKIHVYQIKIFLQTMFSCY